MVDIAILYRGECVQRAARFKSLKFLRSEYVRRKEADFSPLELNFISCSIIICS